MLLEIARWLSDDVRAIGVLEYITMRAVLACATALLIGLVAGPRVIRKLTEMKIGQAVRAYGPESHLVKTGTPTMGGALILIARSEEHTSELQSRENLVCRLLPEKKKNT